MQLRRLGDPLEDDELVGATAAISDFTSDCFAGFFSLSLAKFFGSSSG